MDDSLNNTSLFRDDNAAKTIAQTTFICIVTFIGLFGNCLVIGCILKNRVDRCKASSFLAVNLCVVNIIDCVVNMTFIISASIAQSWAHSDTVCSLHASTVQLVNIEVILGIMAIALDRLICSKRCDIYENLLTTWKTMALIIYTWIQSFGFSIPITSGIIPSIYYQSKYFCTLDRNVSLLFTTSVCVMCFVIPILIVIGSYIFILRMVVLEKANRSNKQTDFYSEITTSQSNSPKDLNQSRFTFTVFILWLFLHGPFIVVNFYEQFVNSYNDNDLALYKLPDAVDLIFSWTRFSFPAVFAVFSLCHKGLRISLKRSISCRKNNSVVDLNSASKLRHSSKKSKARLQLSAMKLKEKYSGNSKESPLTPTTFQVRVLFATSNGIHMQKLQNDLPVTRTDIYCNSSHSQEFTLHGAEKCDVLGSQSDLIQVEDDTSDYDSSGEVDRFSVSHPISSKMAKDIQSDMVHVIPRSLSNPEVGGGNHSADKRKKPERSMMAGDSGIDISSTGVNSMSRKNHSSSIKTSCVPEVETLTEISLPSAVNSISSVVFSQAAERVSRNSMGRVSNSATPKKQHFDQCLQLCDTSATDYVNDTKDNSENMNSSFYIEHKIFVESDSCKPKLKLAEKNLKNQNQNVDVEFSHTVKNDASLVVGMIAPPSRLKPIDHVLKSQRHRKSKHRQNEREFFNKNQNSVEHLLYENLDTEMKKSVLKTSFSNTETPSYKTSLPTDISSHNLDLPEKRELDLLESNLSYSCKTSPFAGGLDSELSKVNTSCIAESKGSKKIVQTGSAQNRPHGQDLNILER